MQLRNEEVHIPVTGAVLAGTLLAPADAGPHPCLRLVSGSGANDRNETVCGHAPFRTIAEYFAAHGYAVLRCDNRGVGGSTGDAGAQDFDGAVADVVATCGWLAGHPQVDPGRIALLGHSEGGLVAAAAGPQVGARASVMLFPDHNHLFQPAGTGSISEYEALPPGPDTAVLRAVADWLSTAEPGAAADGGAR